MTFLTCKNESPIVMGVQFSFSEILSESSHIGSKSDSDKFRLRPFQLLREINCVTAEFFVIFFNNEEWLDDPENGTEKNESKCHFDKNTPEKSSSTKTFNWYWHTNSTSQFQF